MRAASNLVTDHAIPISTIGVTTADRPELLDRCLRSLLRQGGAAGRRDIRILVGDASRDAQNEALARQATATAGRANCDQVAFFGRRKRLALRRRLRSACD